MCIRDSCSSPVAVAQSSSSGVAICYVLPVLWMTSRLAEVGRRLHVAVNTASGVVIPESDVNECLIKICTYQWGTHFTDHITGLFCLLSKYFSTVAHYGESIKSL